MRKVRCCKSNLGTSRGRPYTIYLQRMWPRTKNAMTRKGPAGPWSSPRDVIITYDRSLTETPMIPRADSVGASPECHVRDHSPSSSAVQRFIPGRLLVSRLRCQDTTTVVAMSRFLELSFQQLAGCEELTSGLIAEGVTGRPVANRQYPGLCICAIPERCSERREPVWVQAYCECRTTGRDRRSLT